MTAENVHELSDRIAPVRERLVSLLEGLDARDGVRDAVLGSASVAERLLRRAGREAGLGDEECESATALTRLADEGLLDASAGKTFRTLFIMADYARREGSGVRLTASDARETVLTVLDLLHWFYCHDDIGPGLYSLTDGDDARDPELRAALRLVRENPQFRNVKFWQRQDPEVLARLRAAMDRAREYRSFPVSPPGGGR